MFRAIGEMTFRYRGLVILAWIVLFIVSLFFAPKVASVLVTGGFEDTESESYQSGQLNREVLGGGRSALEIVFSHPEWKADEQRFIDAQLAALEGLDQIDEVGSIIQYNNARDPNLISEDGHTTFAVVEFPLSADDVKQLLPQIREQLEPGPLTMLLTGDPAIYNDIEEVSQSDLIDAERTAFPLSLLVLLFVYGTVIAAGMPVLVGFVSVSSALTAIYLLAGVFDMSIFVLNMATMLGLAIGIDYSLLMVSRFREELYKRLERLGLNHLRDLPPEAIKDSITTSVETAGRSIAFSGVAVFIGLSGLLIFPFMNLKSMGIGGMTVVVFSVLAALTLLPATLATLGHRIDRLSINRWFRRSGGPEKESVKEGWFWKRIAHWVMRFPIPILAMVTVAVVVLTFPVTRIDVSVPDANTLPQGIESREGFEILAEEVGEEELFPVFLVIQTEGDALSSQNIERMFEFTKQVRQDDRIKRVESYTTLVPTFSSAVEYRGLLQDDAAVAAQPALAKTIERTTKDDVTVMRVILDTDDAINDRAKEVVESLREMEFPGGEIYVGGFTAGVTDFIDRLYGVFPYAIAMVFGLTYVVLFILFRSVFLPLKAVVMNTLSIIASFGVMVLVFQEGMFSGVLDFTATGHVDAFLPIVMFSTLFGISMDYEIFLLSRVREAYLETGDNTGAVALGLEKTGRIITSAALIVVIVTGSFALTDIVFIKALGVGLAFAILVDATVIRALAVPSTMKLMGKWNWWAPKWAKPPLPARPGKH